AVRQFFLAAWFDQAMNPVKIVTPFFQSKLVNIEQAGEHRREKLLAFDARILEQPPVLFAEGLKPLANQAAHAFRRLEAHFRDRRGVRPLLIRPGDVAVIGKQLRQPGGEQRMPSGLALKERGERLREVIRGKARIKVVSQMLLAERAERDLFALMM